MEEEVNGLVLHRYFARRAPLADKLALAPTLVVRLTKMLKCPICCNIMSFPVFTKNCMHRFCRNCIEPEIKSERRQCPICRALINSHRELKEDSTIVGLLEIFGSLNDCDPSELEVDTTHRRNLDPRRA
jgi:E3 ubiquitin-protein ligase RNF1/2